MATGTKIFSGSYLDGLGIDLFAWAGFILTDEQKDLVWAEHNLKSLLELCPSAEIEIEEEIDDAPPGMNDTFYSVYSEDAELTRQELRRVILRLVQQKRT
jgi:hypothetical protein